MSRRRLASGIALGAAALLLMGIRTIDAQAPAARRADVIHDQVKGALVHGGGRTEWRRVIGKANVLDAHTLEFADGTRIDLDILVPYREQMGRAGDVLYPAGEDAAAYLRQLVGDRQVMCIRNSSGEGPWSGYVGDTNLERAMIVGGWALADHSSLHGDEIIARENHRGLWRGKFIDFSDWQAGVRLPGEPPPGKLANEREANLLLQECSSREQGCAILIERIVKDLPDTRRLSFPAGNRVTDQLLAQLPQLARLEELNLLECGHVSDTGLAILKHLPGLKRLGFPHSGTDAGMEHVAHLQQLEALSIAWSNVTDAGFRHLSGLPRLRRLSVRNTKITDAALSHLSRLTDLEVLETYQPLISDAGMTHLQSLSKLAYLDIGRSEVTDAGVLQLTGLKKLQIFLVPDRITAAAKERLQKAIPGLKFGGGPDEIP